MSVIPVILSGGCGSRLWPVSRKDRPKQFLDLGMGTSLFRQALERCAPTAPGPRCGSHREHSGALFDPYPIIVSNIAHKFLIAEELLLAGRKADVLLEPEGRNSCPAIAAACLEAVRRDEHAVILVMPSDHNIPDEAEFHKSVAAGISAAREGNIVLFGQHPQSAHPGYGYVGFDDNGTPPFPATRFTEKPTVEIACRLIEEGRLWNAGIFLMRADSALKAMRAHVPEIVERVAIAFERRSPHLHLADGNLACVTDDPINPASAIRTTSFSELECDNFLAAEALSFDHAVLEHAVNVKVLPVAYEWEDLGNWESVSKTFAKDGSNNRVLGSVNAKNSANNVVQSTDRLTALFGVENLIVVDTPDALLVADRNRAGEVNQLVEELKRTGIEQADGGVEHVSPWGSYMRLEEGEGYQVKRLTVLPGASLSLQAHQHRSEHWVVIEGKAKVVIDDKISQLSANDFIHIPVGSRHRLSNCGDGPLIVIEVQTGDYFGEDDIIRYEDAYNRI